MGYHGVWYHDLYQFDSQHPCYLAGHVHVGGLIDWDTAREATEISILKTIDYLDQFSYTEGDVNITSSTFINNLRGIRLNGNGEMTGTHWIKDGGYFVGPICLTNTNNLFDFHSALRFNEPSILCNDVPTPFSET